MLHSEVRSAAAVMLAPSGLALAVAPLALALLAGAKPSTLTRFVFLLGVIFPLGDLSLSLAGLALGRTGSDLAQALGRAGTFWVPVWIAPVAVLGVLARPAFERIFETGLSPAQYLLLGTLLLSLPWWMVAAGSFLGG